VLRYTDHPALLIRALGNGTEGFAAGDNPSMWKAINAVAALTTRMWSFASKAKRPSRRARNDRVLSLSRLFSAQERR